MRMECPTFRALAPELALGIAEGDERAAALDHVAGCDDCRAELAALTATVDAVIQAAPAAEPPSGFELRALASFEPAPTTSASATAPAGRAPRLPRAVLAAAAVVLVAAAVGLGVRAVTGDGRGTGPASEVAASSHPTAALTDAHDVEVGTVRVERHHAADGTTSSDLVVSIPAGGPQGSYRVECDYESGRSYRAGALDVGAAGLDDWRATVAVPTYDLTRVRLVSTTGADNLEAEFDG